MKALGRRLILLLAALALAAGAPAAFAVPPALAAEPCLHEHQHGAGIADHDHDRHQHRHDHGAAGCLCCCIGSCIAISDLPHNPVAVILCIALPVAYWDTGLRLAGRSIRPDPAPPRSSALS